MEDSWYKRGKTYQTKSLQALKDLYAPIPGSEPKGVQRNAKRAPEAFQTQEAESQEQKPNPI